MAGNAVKAKLRTNTTRGRAIITSPFLQIHFPLSVIGPVEANNITERDNTRLLRPIFINGVEVGFAYANEGEGRKKLSTRGITITLWYFISRGHIAQVLLPFCFKTYPDKSDNWDELMSLYRMNLVDFTPDLNDSLNTLTQIRFSLLAPPLEISLRGLMIAIFTFTQMRPSDVFFHKSTVDASSLRLKKGYGSDKYTELNRILAMRTREYGGCMVARSQMHSIVAENPLLDRTVERKLLMPTFVGPDLMFPLDGPLGRRGSPFAETIICPVEDPEWERCVVQQMTLRDQKIWMTNIADIAQFYQQPETEYFAQWVTAARKVCQYRLINRVCLPTTNVSLRNVPLQLHPAETNPPSNRGFSNIRGWRNRQNFAGRSWYRGNYNNHSASARYRSWHSFVQESNEEHYFIPWYRRNTPGEVPQITARDDEGTTNEAERTSTLVNATSNGVQQTSNEVQMTSTEVQTNLSAIGNNMIEIHNTSAEGNGNFFGEQQSPRQLLAPTAEPEGQPRQFIEMDVQGAVNYNRVANIFGHEMAKMICSRHPAMASSKTVLNKLADFILNEHMGNRDSQPASNSQSVSQILEEYKDNESTAIHIVANGSQTTAGTNSVIESELIRIEPDLIPAAMNLEDGLTEDTGTGSDTDGEEIDLIQFSDSE